MKLGLLRVFWNRMVRKIFGRKSKGCRELQDEELHNLLPISYY
jgi:hypothetical protein